jgi:hypothetical protein
LGAQPLPDYKARSIAGLFKTAYDGGQSGASDCELCLWMPSTGRSGMTCKLA